MVICWNYLSLSKTIKRIYVSEMISAVDHFSLMSILHFEYVYVLALAAPSIKMIQFERASIVAVDQALEQSLSPSIWKLNQKNEKKKLFLISVLFKIWQCSVKNIFWVCTALFQIFRRIFSHFN